MKKFTKKQAKKMFEDKVKQGVATKKQIKIVNEMNKLEGITATVVYPSELLALGYTAEQIAELQNKQVLIID
ncbi:TPA: hypothetical protein LQB52_002521 [Enterococcus faecium]|uniref:hypothetical protein n=1 Tax=Enterococcus faecium TaxID=1352 RepID=UPI00298F2E08|nr:hypothetical protein [Enterococcus faecium]MDW7852022.1 hypothetical protein [Enterococcus faecium]HBL3429222.1 hypothetical protein [Enterococcus faecium]